MHLTGIVILGLCCAIGGAAQAARQLPTGAVEIRSPDGRIRAVFSLLDRPGEPSAPAYSVDYRNRELVHAGGLGIDLAPSGPMRSHLKVTRVTRRSIDGSFSLVAGKNARVRDHCEEAVISLSEQGPPHRRFELIVRACDDGVAFRYRVPSQVGLADLVVTDEQTTFAISGNPTAYTLPVPSYTTPYEFHYQARPVEAIPDGALLALPLTLRYADNTCLAITEADLDDYAGLYLGGTASPGVLVSRLSPRLDAPGIKVRTRLPHLTPWRVLMIAKEPARLVESNLVSILSPPCALADTSWIHPGKTTFPWWNGYDVEGQPFKGGLNTETMKYYIDFCAAHGIPYHSLDGLDNIAWYGGTIVPYVGQGITESLPGLDLQGVIAYARQKGVRLRLWMHSGAPRAHMKTAFPLYEKWGIEGVMVDFVERDDQETVNFIHDLVALAAKHHLTVTLHNISKPTGLSRTYPNLLTVESSWNLEYNKWDPVGVRPEHELTIPFTRMLAGPVDFHSGSFRNVTEAQFKPRNVAPVTIGTRARQLARYVVYDGGLPMMADSPDAYRGQPGLDLLTAIPTTWDQTRTLNGEIGKYITMARRSGRQWYVGAMGGSEATVLNVPLRFLGTGRYTAEIWSDDVIRPNQPTSLLYRKRSVTSADILQVAMAPAGGQVIRFTPKR
ncbi:MAG TPA: glycoside hydrolase family 97 protein [Armatimonadota bacterium]